MKPVENKSLRKLKRAVIKEELVALTGDFKEALVLNQLIYWSERVKDSDQFLKEELERERNFADGSVESPEDITENLRNGWIYKTSEEMTEDVMLTCSSRTMDRIFNSLVDKQYISKRRNPKQRWDKTWQYRVDLHKIQKDLLSLGYVLEGYSIGENENNTPDVASKRQNVDSKRQNVDSKRQNVGAIPEITTEVTNKDNKDNKENETETSFSPGVPFSSLEDKNPELDKIYIEAYINQYSLREMFGEEFLNVLLVRTNYDFDNFKSYASKVYFALTSAEKELGYSIQARFFEDSPFAEAMKDDFTKTLYQVLLAMKTDHKIIKADSVFFTAMKNVSITWINNAKNN